MSIKSHSVLSVVESAGSLGYSLNFSGLKLKGSGVEMRFSSESLVNIFKSGY